MTPLEVDRPKAGRIASDLTRSLVATPLLTGLTAMIGRDIFVRRFTAPPPPPDVTERSR